MTEYQIALAAPPAPACYPTQRAWVLYLAACQDDKAKSGATHPFDRGGHFKPGFDYCVDCLPDHRRRMCSAARCNPPRRHLIEEPQ